MIGSMFTNLVCHAEDHPEVDPFLGVQPKPIEVPEPTGFGDNFGFRKEIMSEFGRDREASASRQSLGAEALKKFSTETKTLAAVDTQIRLVRRDGFVDSPNDMEGMNRKGWALEYHNLYADFYDVAGSEVGRFNARIGHFYLPFGLNLQTDTHATILQLSNEQNFGFDRDWYAGLWGILSQDLRYDAYYLAGSGYDLDFKGQAGLVGLRVSLANKYLSDYGVEGGISYLGGEKLSANGLPPAKIETTRYGVDGRYRRPVPSGLVTWTTELSAGKDDSNQVLTQLHQLDYLHQSRRWGAATQYRWFDRTSSRDAAVMVEATWYFRNDVSGSNLQWIKLNTEYRTERQVATNDVVWTLQYYQYW